jgi:hypothetical protein
MVRLDCPCFPFQLLNQLLNFHEIWCEWYASELMCDHFPRIYLINFVYNRYFIFWKKMSVLHSHILPEKEHCFLHILPASSFTVIWTYIQNLYKSCNKNITYKSIEMGSVFGNKMVKD